jgi:hypothetical protein
MGAANGTVPPADHTQLLRRKITGDLTEVRRKGWRAENMDAVHSAIHPEFHGLDHVVNEFILHQHR